MKKKIKDAHLKYLRDRSNLILRILCNYDLIWVTTAMGILWFWWSGHMKPQNKTEQQVVQEK